MHTHGPDLNPPTMTAPAAYLKMAADGLITLPHLTTQIHSRTSGTARPTGTPNTYILLFLLGLLGVSMPS